MQMPQKHHIWLRWTLVAISVSLVALIITLIILLIPKIHSTITGNTPNSQPATPDPELTRAQQILADMTLEEKIGQMFMVDTANLAVGQRGGSTNLNATDNAKTLTPDQKQNLAKYAPSGIVFFGGNIQNATQVKKYISDLQTNSKYGLFIATDQEGGIVDRLAAAGITRFGNMATIGATKDPSQAYNVGATYGKEMKALGFNIDFAPVADVNTNPKNPVIGVRAFGSDPNLVASMVSQEVKGLQDNGVSATLKHFPGHGDTSTDTHTGIAVVQNDLNRLRQVELVPFKAGITAGADLVLTAHIQLPKIDPSNLPATMSKTIVTDLLRTELGFTGVIITDALDMDAISAYYTPDQVVTNCVNAGIDILLMPKKYFDTYSAFVSLAKSHKITEDRINQSVLRILNLKLKLGVIK